MTNPKIVLQIGGSREGTDYRFVADADTLKRIAHQILDCVEQGKTGPWGPNSNVILCEEIAEHRPGVFGTSSESAFLSFEQSRG